MFGSVFQMRPLAGHEQQVFDAFESWNRERRPKVAGVVQSLGFRLVDGSGDFIGVAVFASREAYEKNAQDPEQDSWYQELRSHLAADPVWHDGDVIFQS